MKISITTEPVTLFLLQKITLHKTQRIARVRSDKILLSQQQELFQMLSNKCINYTGNANGKPRKLTIKYHLASVLLDITVNTISDRILPLYEHNKLEIFKNNLHQKLI